MTTAQPDVVLIHGHDLGTWLSCYGMASVPSPNLGRRAADSVIFDNAFATAPLCSPARASLFTGTSPHVNGVQGLAHAGWRYRSDVRTLPELLGAAGYHSVLVGLQHEHTNPAVLGYDEVAGLGFLPRAAPVAAAAERYLRDRAARRGRREPMLMVVGTWETHRPWPAEDYTHADPARVDVPDFLPDNPFTRADIAAFHGSIRQFDQAVGHLVRAVDRYLDPQNTMVIFTTDHGAAFPRAKGTLYDPGVRVALIVRPPGAWGITPGRRTGLVSHLDIVPTLLDAAGAPGPAWLEGTTLLPVLAGQSARADDRVITLQKSFHDSYDPIRAVRTRRHKLIRNFSPGTPMPMAQDLAESLTRQGMTDADFPPRPAVELYDLVNDPAERVNLADEPGHAAVRRSLEEYLSEWMRTTADPLLAGPVPPPTPQSRQTDALPSIPHRLDHQRPDLAGIPPGRAE